MTLKGHTDTVTGLSLSPDGTHLLSNAMVRAVATLGCPHAPYLKGNLDTTRYLDYPYLTSLDTCLKSAAWRHLSFCWWSMPLWPRHASHVDLSICGMSGALRRQLAICRELGVPSCWLSDDADSVVGVTGGCTGCRTTRCAHGTCARMRRPTAASRCSPATLTASRRTRSSAPGPPTAPR